MKTKEKIISEISSRLMRIINRHLALEEHPIRFSREVLLTPKEIHTIQAIGKHEHINVKELGEYFGVTKSAASQMAGKLVDKGFVNKNNPAHNNKELELSLTEPGKKAYCLHERIHEEHAADLTMRLNSLFSSREMEKASELLGVIEDAINERILSLMERE
jgi:DNA-binding MarR family transcriptional regulator